MSLLTFAIILMIVDGALSGIVIAMYEIKTGRE
jgi:hypothetical protein